MRYEDVAARTLSQLLFYELFREKSCKAGEVQSALSLGAAVLAGEEEAYQLLEAIFSTGKLPKSCGRQGQCFTHNRNKGVWSKMMKNEAGVGKRFKPWQIRSGQTFARLFLRLTNRSRFMTKRALSAQE